MKERGLLDQYLLQRWKVSLYFEWPVLIAIGAAGKALNWTVLGYPLFSHIVGWALLIVGMMIHRISHLVNQQAHADPDAITRVVRDGIYARIRHPGYTGLMLMYAGFPLVWRAGIYATGAAAIVFILLTIVTAMREEQVLEAELGEEYTQYVNDVPWRFIPGVV